MAEEAGVEPTEDASASSNGFEARAPHRERYSSDVDLALCAAAVNHGFAEAASPIAPGVATAGKNLRFIRINGTLIGGAVGLVLYVLTP